jgi:hypothetical protein
MVRSGRPLFYKISKAANQKWLQLTPERLKLFRLLHYPECSVSIRVVFILNPRYPLNGGAGFRSLFPGVDFGLRGKRLPIANPFLALLSIHPRTPHNHAQTTRSENLILRPLSRCPASISIHRRPIRHHCLPNQQIQSSPPSNFTNRHSLTVPISPPFINFTTVSSISSAKGENSTPSRAPFGILSNRCSRRIPSRLRWHGDDV